MPVSNLLSVSTQVEHPNFVNPPKVKLKQGEERLLLSEFPTHVRTARRWDSTPLPPLLCARLERAWDTVQAYTTRIRA